VFSAPVRSRTHTLPLTGHAHASAIAAYRRGKPVTAGQFAHDVMQVADSLPRAGHILNVCGDRYRFTVVLCAAIVRGQLTLLPPTTTPNVIKALREFARDAYYVSDDPALRLELPRFELPRESAMGQASPQLPQVAADRIVAYVFTSGSTGTPQPHAKHWGTLVLNVRNEAARLGAGPGHAVLGTVPPQHMYGLESTVLMPLASGAAITAERLYYPADIDAAIAQLPAPRIVFTTPFHLRAWIESGATSRPELIVSATAPLSVGLARAAEEATGAELHEIYGCTEAGQVASRRTTAGAEWRLLDGLRMTHDAERAVVSGGHVDVPTALQDVIEPLGEGRFLLHGRTADMVNIAGKRNSLGYLNHQLTSIPGVADGVFFLPTEPGEDDATRLTALAVAPGLTASQVLAALRERIDPAFMPRPLVLVDALPRALTGKLPREALLALVRGAGTPQS